MGSAARKKIFVYLRFATDSSFPSVFNFLFLGCGLWTKVHSWVWNWHSTQLVWPSLITHLLFLRRHASHGLSFLLLVLDPDSPDVVLLMLAESWPLPLVLLFGSSSEEESGRGFRAAIAMGAVRAIEVGFDMA